MIIMPRKELIVPVRMVTGLKGFFRMQCINKFSGKVTKDTGWFPNTILNAGRDQMGKTSTWMDYCQVGTDGTFPATLPERQAETSLGNHHAGTNNVVTGSLATGQSGSAPYFGWKRKTWRFLAGTVATALSEAGVGWADGVANNSTIISRAPILDPVLGTPTTIVPLSDELLDVSYELRYYPPLVDVLGPQVTLYGQVYDTITRAANVTGSYWSAWIGSIMGQYSLTSSNWSAYSGNIGTILTGPDGTSKACDNANQFNSSYSDNSYQVVMNSGCGPNGWNVVGGIRSMLIATTAGQYQTQFNAVPGGETIPKSTAYSMTMAWTLSWEEKV